MENIDKFKHSTQALLLYKNTLEAKIKAQSRRPLTVNIANKELVSEIFK